MTMDLPWLRIGEWLVLVLCSGSLLFLLLLFCSCFWLKKREVDFLSTVVYIYI